MRDSAQDTQTLTVNTETLTENQRLGNTHITSRSGPSPRSEGVTTSESWSEISESDFLDRESEQDLEDNQWNVNDWSGWNWLDSNSWWRSNGWDDRSNDWTRWSGG